MNRDYNWVVYKLPNGKIVKDTIGKNGEIKMALCKTCCDERGITSARMAKKEKLYYHYKDGKIICPRCNIIRDDIEVVKTPEQIKKEKEEKEKERNEKALEELHLYRNGDLDLIAGIKYYSLSANISYDDWLKIKPFMFWYRSHGEEDFYGEKPYGWVTTQPQKVEEILLNLGLMKEENTLKNLEIKAKNEDEERKEKLKQKQELKSQIDYRFKDGEKPFIELNYSGTIEDYGDEIVQIYENPNYKWNIYGGGQEWVICEEHIWFLKNNGFDGADWSLNNVATGGAGAIGVRVPYNYELEEMIKEYIRM